MSGKSMLRSFLVRFGRLGLQQRIMLYVSGGLAVVLAAYGLVSLQAVRQSTDLVFQERLAVARAVGQEIDRDLVHVQGELSEANEVAGPALVGGHPDDARAAMDAVYQHWLHYDGFDNPCVISLTDPRGMALWTEPGSASCPVDLSSHLAPKLRCRRRPSPMRWPRPPITAGCGSHFRSAPRISWWAISWLASAWSASASGSRRCWRCAS